MVRASDIEIDSTLDCAKISSGELWDREMKRQEEATAAMAGVPNPNVDADPRVVRPAQPVPDDKVTFERETRLVTTVQFMEGDKVQNIRFTSEDRVQNDRADLIALNVTIYKDSKYYAEQSKTPLLTEASTRERLWINERFIIMTWEDMHEIVSQEEEWHSRYPRLKAPKPTPRTSWA